MTVSAQRTSTGTIAANGTKILGVYLVHSGTAGTAVFKDGGASGTTRITLDSPAAAGPIYIPVPGGGINFGTDCHVTLTNIDSVTVFYEELAP